MAANVLLKEFFSEYSGKLPEHELEILLEAAFHREFPDRERLSRRQLYSGEDLPGTSWITQATIWAEKRLQSRVPLQHLTREQCFFGYYFEVGPEVLIPRPETEVLVERVLGWMRSHAGGPLWGAEIGAGSGIIPITLLLEGGPDLKMVATEVSPEALRRAQDNSARFAVGDRLTFLSVEDPRDVLGGLRQWVSRQRRPLDFLVSNPPYLRRDPSEVEEDVEASEPAQALFAPELDPLFYYREIRDGARDVVNAGGRVFLEIPHERAEEIRGLFSTGFEDVRILPDLAGKSRVLEAKLVSWTK